MMDATTLNEPAFSPHNLNKYASLMASGNGYLGVRATHEEDYTRQTRGLYLAGLYHRAGSGETQELINLPDIVGVQIELNGTPFSLLSGHIDAWDRQLNFATGELRRSVIWQSPCGAHFALESRRFASAAQPELFALRLTITPLDSSARITLSTGIDATQTNTGRQHLDETQIRVFGQHLLQGIYTTQDGTAEAIITSYCHVSGEAHSNVTAKNRCLWQHSIVELAAGESVTLEKLNWLSWSGDRRGDIATRSQQHLDAIRQCARQGYNRLFRASMDKWREYWLQCRVKIEAHDPRDQQALDYALYHLYIMTPEHDERSSIAAKGLTGEGYKGHVFWDTEVFLLPFHLFTRPAIARQLLRYRWHNLPGARAKARRNGWQGALFPWESARYGEEETPEFAAINIRTGERQKVASAEAEHHLVADIAWAVTAYWQVTGDAGFMAHEGMDLLMETARFWISRTTECCGRLEIHDVIGPDEYTEHVNNNAYTNYMAYENVEQAVHFARHFGRTDEAFYASATRFLQRLWLPKCNQNSVMPQDDTFLSKPAINLSQYKLTAGKQTILLDYSRAEVNEMQILKQADVVMLNYMLPDRFTRQECLANLQFYEPRTIHDSSLSKAIHGIVAARCGDRQQAYRFWREGIDIDLGEEPHSSDDGIHAAATGAIWLGATQGFAGLNIYHGTLQFAPRLPDNWQKMVFPLQWQGVAIRCIVTHQHITLETSAPVSLWLYDQYLNLEGTSTYALKDFILSQDGTAPTEEQ